MLYGDVFYYWQHFFGICYIVHIKKLIKDSNNTTPYGTSTGSIPVWGTSNERIIMSDIVEAPWTDDQVKSLNEYQKSGVIHPFTGNNELAPDDSDNILVATTDGWISEVDPEYHQNWAWSWMADWSWKQMKVVFNKFIKENE
jgi:hypothetical protein